MAQHIQQLHKPTAAGRPSPSETFEDRLNNRFAQERLIDQHQVSTKKRRSITNAPNCPRALRYIFRRVRQGISVGLETVRLVKGLPRLEPGEVHAES